MLPNGKQKSVASYSSRAAFKFCRRYFKLTRVDGWRQKVDGASMAFGHAIEAAWVHSCQHGGHGGVPAFVAAWTKASKEPGFEKLIYRGDEESFENLMRCGTEMMQIFEARWASYPFSKAKKLQFQLPLKKRIFPQTTYDKIENIAYLDAVVSLDSSSPWLEKRINGDGEWSDSPWKGGSSLCELIIDCKTSGQLFPEGLIVLDPQLVEYAWMLGSNFAGFLNFVKESHGYRSGSYVSLLEPAGTFLPGSEVRVLDKNKDGTVWIGNAATLDAYDKACRSSDGASLKGKALDAAAEAFLEFAPAWKVPATALSKQRVQFCTARIPVEDITEMGKMIGQTTVEMVMAHEQDFYPMEAGLRYPNKKCNTCDMRSLCANNREERDAQLTRTGEEWMDATLEEDK